MALLTQLQLNNNLYRGDLQQPNEVSSDQIISGDMTGEMVMVNGFLQSLNFDDSTTGFQMKDDGVAKLGGTSTLNTKLVSDVQGRSFINFEQFSHIGQYNDGFTETIFGNDLGSLITRSLLTTYLFADPILAAGQVVTVDLYGPTIATDTDGWGSGFEFVSPVSLNSGVEANGDCFIGLYHHSDPGSTALPNNGVDVNKHIGFYLIGNSPTTEPTVITSNADATTQTKTTITDYTFLGEWNVLRLVYSSTSILFYINDTLVSTHTTNLPATTESLRIRFAITMRSDSSENSSFFIGNNYLYIGARNFTW